MLHVACVRIYRRYAVSTIFQQATLTDTQDEDVSTLTQYTMSAGNYTQERRSPQASSVIKYKLYAIMLESWVSC